MARDDTSVCSGCGRSMPDEIVDQLCDECQADPSVDPTCSTFGCVLTIKQHETVGFGVVRVPVHQERVKVNGRWVEP